MEEPAELTFQDLREMTDDFSEKRIVGAGGFGIVYKGVTKHGKDVAVKILRDGTNLDLNFKQFQNEFYNLMKVKHDNIVHFLGYCYEIETTSLEYNGVTVPVEKIHMALCFEYLHNGSLKNYLSDESSGLDWHARYKIIKGICEGLRYIHETESLLHLDLKPGNILLHQDMVPKIADFGLSKIIGDKLTRTTQSPLGTPGFQPPEYVEKGEISEKFDIYSLGVIIINIVSGPDGYRKCDDMPSQEFIDQVKTNWRERWQKSSNASLLESTCCHQVETCTKIALLKCLDKDSQKRPDIVKIIDMLNETETDNYQERQILQPPKNGHKTMCGTMTRHDNMELIEEHKVINDLGEDLIVGRDQEVNNIMASLLESIKSAEMVILPIYGIGGIGKTTFAKLIYHHTNFKCYSHVWVYVSRRFDLKEISKSIDSQLSGEENQANELLISKEVLIVLDDLWEDNPVKIEELKLLFNRLKTLPKKVIVLVTTRTADIARKIRSNVEPYEIEYLTDDMCWDIIKEKSGFEDVHDKENENIVDIGKKIAQKCGGVALAAQTLGFMLRSIKHDEWITERDNDIWNETILEDTSLPRHVLASLKLSYAFSMDHFLKKCFTYCSIFPKGHTIVKHDLIYQWISLGFIMPTKILSTLQLCEKYIVRLLGLTFLQHSTSAKTYQAYGEHDTVFIMHDLVHDLATSLLGDKIFDQSKQVNAGESSCCYALLTNCSKPLESCMTSPAKLSSLRFLDCWRTELHGAAFEPAKSLRSLDLSKCSIQKLPDCIGQLKQLGYLNAPRIRDRMVPECITKLSKLRYLSLRGSCAIQTLPDSIGEMEGLVYLDLSGCVEIEKLPESFGDLKSLEHVDFTNCQKVTRVFECLTRITNLQYLNLSNCKNIGYLPSALGSLTELQYLNLFGSSCLSGNELSKAEFLGSLTKLKYLNLSSVDEPDIINLPEAVGSLTELKYLNLANNSRLKTLPASFGNLCNLVHLDLSYCSCLQYVPAALNGLTKLQYLDLCDFDNHDVLEGLHEVLGSLRELRHLNLCGRIARTLYYPDDLNSLLERICTLANLEYLDLSFNDNIDSIPDTIGKLRKLRTLDLTYCRSLERLPACISEIGSLKNLDATECSKLDRSTLPQCNTSDDESSIWKSSGPGFLQMTRLENVKSAKEAQKIKLVEKTDTTSLLLEWTVNAKRFVDDAEVLKELEPPHSVSSFTLAGYTSVTFPPWVRRIRYYLPGLTSICMWHLPRCWHLPPLGQLPNLQKLSIVGMDSIKKIGTDLYGGTRAFPRLEKFSITDMECLEEWNTVYTTDKSDLDEPAFPCLSSVEIKRCPRLRIKPQLPRSMDKLEVHSSDEVLLSSFWKRGHFGASKCTHLHVERCKVPLNRWNFLCHLPYLEDLSITDCSDLTYSSPNFLSGLTSLRTLTVRGPVSGGQKILKLPEGLGDLNSLTELDIGNCKGIKALPGSVQKLTSLHTLSCRCMVSLPKWLGDLTSLVKLEIRSCKRVKTLPDAIQQLTRLQTLTVQGCKIVSLPEWLGDLASLMKLEIRFCRRIKALPDNIKQLTRLQTLTLKKCESIISLPETLGDLASLTNLEIIHCLGFRTLPDNIQNLTCLQTLKVIGCKKLVSLPETLGNLNSLKELVIANCWDISTLPDSIQQLTSLQTLMLHGCSGINFLPEGLGDLISLKKLHISNCYGIETLPDTIQKLTRLQRIEIDECPGLVRWCLSEENKMKLAHIEETVFSKGLWSFEDCEVFETDSESYEELENEDLDSDPEDHLNKSAPISLELKLGHDSSPLSRIMAFQMADPGPFLPEGMHLEHVENRQVMVRAVASSRPVPRNEDWAIVTIQTLPGNVLNFGAVREVLEEFFADVARVQIRDIQRSHLGQALVRFTRIIDRERLVLNSPHQFDYVTVSFARHNEGRNWRHVTFNREVWLMLLGFPFDYCEEEYIDTALAPFGKMINWDQDPVYKTRLMVRARVADLESVPHFIVFSETDGMDSDSWTIQCEIVQQETLGAGPPDEDLPVEAQNFDQMPFALFGLEQQGPGPAIQQQPQLPPQQQIAPGQQMNEQGAYWDFWSNELHPMGHNQQVNQEIPLNQQVVPLLQDLNEEPVQEDPTEVVIHPPQGHQQGLHQEQVVPLLQDLNEEPVQEDTAEVIIHPPQGHQQRLHQEQELDWAHRSG